MIEFLSSQPARVDFQEIGSAVSIEEKGEEKIHELAKARAKELNAETGDAMHVCLARAYSELDI